MDAIANGWNIAMVGAWNTAILTPEWLGEHIFESPQNVEVLVSFGHDQNRTLHFRDVGFSLSASSNRLVLAPLTLTKPALAGAERGAIALIRVLPHTPLAAIGINFRFREEDGNTAIENVVRSVDTDALAEQGLAIEDVEVRRALSGIELFGGPTLLLKLTSTSSGAAQVDFNYHYERPPGSWAENHLKGAFVGLFSHAQRVMQAYKIVIPELT